LHERKIEIIIKFQKKQNGKDGRDLSPEHGSGRNFPERFSGEIEAFLVVWSRFLLPAGFPLHG